MDFAEEAMDDSEAAEDATTANASTVRGTSQRKRESIDEHGLGLRV